MKLLFIKHMGPYLVHAYVKNYESYLYDNYYYINEIRIHIKAISILTKLEIEERITAQKIKPNQLLIFEISDMKAVIIVKRIHDYE
jgi:hypothetical protein